MPLVTVSELLVVDLYVCVFACVSACVVERQGPWNQTDAKEWVYFPLTVTDKLQLSKLT